MEEETLMVVSAIVIVGIMCAALLYVGLLPNPAAPMSIVVSSRGAGTQQHPAPCGQSGGNCTNIITGLNMSISISPGPGRAFYVNVSEFNPSNSTINVSAINMSGVGPSALSYIGYVCGQPEIPTFYIGVSIGDYNISNIDNSSALPLANPLDIRAAACPAVVPATSFRFMPFSDNVTALPLGVVGADELNRTISGYWNGTGFSNLTGGTYTVVAADRWGLVGILHWNVLVTAPPP